MILGDQAGEAAAFSQQEIIAALYRCLLGREPDKAGRVYWQQKLTASGSIERVIDGLLKSDEFRERALSGGDGGDLLCKWHRFPDDKGAFLVLPLGSNDPVIDAYLRGDACNNYMLELLSEMTVAGDRVVDLGCHIGSFSVGAAAMGRKVLAVDAAASHLRLVQHSKALNHLDNLICCQTVISRQRMMVRFLERGLFGSIDYDADSPTARMIEARGLDDMLADFPGPKVRFIKMDIEGSEYDALLSGEALLREDEPVILFESNNKMLAKAGQSVGDLRRLIEALGYRVFRIEGDRWVYAPPDQLQPECWVDMLALGRRDQLRWAARIDQKWEPHDILRKCREWAGPDHAESAGELLLALRQQTFEAPIAGAVMELTDHLEQMIADSSLTC